MYAIRSYYVSLKDFFILMIKIGNGSAGIFIRTGSSGESEIPDNGRIDKFSLKILCHNTDTEREIIQYLPEPFPLFFQGDFSLFPFGNILTDRLVNQQFSLFVKQGAVGPALPPDIFFGNSHRMLMRLYRVLPCQGCDSYNFV